MKRPAWQVRKCRSHAQGGCWVVRRYSIGTMSYLFQSAHGSFPDAIGATA